MHTHSKVAATTRKDSLCNMLHTKVNNLLGHERKLVEQEMDDLRKRPKRPADSKLAAVNSADVKEESYIFPAKLQEKQHRLAQLNYLFHHQVNEGEIASAKDLDQIRNYETQLLENGSPFYGRNDLARSIGAFLSVASCKETNGYIATVKLQKLYDRLVDEKILVNTVVCIIVNAPVTTAAPPPFEHCLRTNRIIVRPYLYGAGDERRVKAKEFLEVCKEVIQTFNCDWNSYGDIAINSNDDFKAMISALDSHSDVIIERMRVRMGAQLTSTTTATAATATGPGSAAMFAPAAAPVRVMTTSSSNNIYGFQPGFLLGKRF